MRNRTFNEEYKYMKGLGPNHFMVTENCLHIYPGGSYNMVEGRGYELDVAKLHLLQCHIQELVNHMCDCGELKKDYKADELLSIARGLYDTRFKNIVENFSLWKKEFDIEKITVPVFLEKEPWTDVSWHNDVCPSFIHKDLLLRVWVNYDKVEDREWEEMPKFGVEKLLGFNDEVGIETDGTVLYECDFEDSLVSFLEEYAALNK